MNIWSDERPVLHPGKSMLNRQTFSMEQMDWMIVAHKKRGWEAVYFKRGGNHHPSVILKKEGCKDIAFHYTEVGGIESSGSYYCIVLDRVHTWTENYKKEVNV